jgi:hypothetical protein
MLQVLPVGGGLPPDAQPSPKAQPRIIDGSGTIEAWFWHVLATCSHCSPLLHLVPRLVYTFMLAHLASQ